MKALSMHSIPITSDQPGFIPAGHPDLEAKIQAVVPGYAQLPGSVTDEDVLLIQDRLPVNPTQRLVVVVPSGEIDESALARRVWQIAAGTCFKVLYLVLSSGITQTAYQRRRLADLAAITSGQYVHAHASVIDQKNWRQTLERTLQPGDLLVCLASHKVPKYLVWRASLGEQLAKTAGVPVYLIGGIEIGLGPQERQAIKEVLAWIAFLVVISAFLGMLVMIDRFTPRPLSTILTCLSVVVEIFLIWKIDEWIR